MTAIKFIAAAAVALTVATPLVAQEAITGVQSLNDRIDDITDAAQDDLNRQNDAARFGPTGVPQGWRGSFALSASATNGNSDTGNISIGSRLTYGVGDWAHSFGLAGEFARDGKKTTNEQFFGTLESNRYFNDRFYVFGLGRYNYNGQSTREHEAFVGFGPGYRVLNSETVAWRIQAGPGYRYVKESNGNDFSELGGIVSSRFYYGLSDTLSVTNDTDFMSSEHSNSASNELGLNIKATDTLSTRFSYRTDFNSAAKEQYDNKLGVSLVVGF